jgi:hypothetical protein
MTSVSDQPYHGTHGATGADARLRTALLAYIAVLATVFAIAAIALLISANDTAQTNARKIEQLQRATNDNLCNQQEYQGGTQCEGGDANGGSPF